MTPLQHRSEGEATVSTQHVLNGAIDGAEVGVGEAEADEEKRARRQQRLQVSDDGRMVLGIRLVVVAGDDDGVGRGDTAVHLDQGHAIILADAPHLAVLNDHVDLVRLRLQCLLHQLIEVGGEDDIERVAGQQPL